VTAEPADAREPPSPLGEADAMLDERAALAAAEDQEALEAAWSQHGFASDPPEVAFDDEVVLLVGRPDDSCADEPVRLGVDEERLEIGWATPPGPCDDLLMQWVQAIQVHRGVLAEEVTFGPDEPYEDELEETTISLPPYEGEAPPDPAPPEAISDEELEAMFADQPVDRCGPEHEPFRDDRVDGGKRDDPEVAAAQRGRASHRLPSDEDTARDAMTDDDRVEGFDFPLTEEEQARDHRVTQRIEQARQALETAGWDLEEEAIPVIARDGRIRPVVVTHEEDVGEVTTMLDAEIGVGEIDIEVTPWPAREVVEAQQRLTELMGHADEAGAIVSLSGPPGPVRVGMVDPTPGALAEVSETVDPELVCVEVALTDVEPVPTGGRARSRSAAPSQSPTAGEDARARPGSARRGHPGPRAADVESTDVTAGDHATPSGARRRHRGGGPRRAGRVGSDPPDGRGASHEVAGDLDRETPRGRGAAPAALAPRCRGGASCGQAPSDGHRRGDVLLRRAGTGPADRGVRCCAGLRPAAGGARTHR
jgi:hypothetical protein